MSLRLWNLNLDIILASYNFLIIAFLLHIYFTIFITTTVHYISLFIHIFHIQLFINPLHPFGYFSTLSLSPPLIFSLLCLSIIYIYCFSHPPITSLHHISVIFYSFPLTATIPDAGLRPKRHISVQFLNKLSTFCSWTLNFLDYCIFICHDWILLFGCYQRVALTTLSKIMLLWGCGSHWQHSCSNVQIGSVIIEAWVHLKKYFPRDRHILLTA